MLVRGLAFVVTLLILGLCGWLAMRFLDYAARLLANADDSELDG